LHLDAARVLFEEAMEAWKSNPWFTPNNVSSSINALSQMLAGKNLQKWLGLYPGLFNEKTGRTLLVGVVMAGNIPLVGFHDFLCTVISGHGFVGKLSGKDEKLPVAIASLLVEIEPALESKIRFSESEISRCDMVVATGSDNSARYFEHAYGGKPHIFRKNRNSVAILTGQETSQELELLANDIFSYFGLGCRNVSKLYVPKGYDLNTLKKHWKKYSNLTSHEGYNNNLIYNKAFMKVGETPYIDFGFCTLKYDFDLSSPISVLNVEEYDSLELCQKSLLTQIEKIQCIAGNFKSDDFQIIPFGKSQTPDLWNYADGVDTMGFLLEMAEGRGLRAKGRGQGAEE
jgi:hypothetical protein